MTHTCQASVGEYHRSLCGNAAKTQHKGKHYCGVHDPVRLAAKRAQKYAEWQQEWDAKERRWAYDALLAKAGESVRDFKGDLPPTLDALRKRLRAQTPDSTP